MKRLVLAVLVLSNVALYSLWLSYSPIYMHDAEVLFALHARSIAATLRDTNGTFLPLYFHMPSIGAEVWFQPMIVYFSALFLKVLPFAEWSVRFPSVVVGTIDVVLIYLVALRLFRSATYAVAAAVLLALTPAHFIHSRMAMDYLYPVPFVLLWLWCLLKFDETGRPHLMWIGGFALGVGIYSYVAALAFMPLYLVFTWLFLLAKYRRVRLVHVTTTIAFVLPLAGFLTWRIIHPEVFAGTAYRYAITRGGLLSGVRGMLRYNAIGDYLSNYWNFYNPNFLFLVGSPNFQSSTRAAGVFLIPVALFLAVGGYDVIVNEKPRVSALLLAGLLTAPIPAVLVEEPFAIYREMEIIPFAILIAAFGVRRLMRADRRLWRGVALAALVVVPLQFGYFLKDYFTDYRLNSAGWFGWNIRAAVEKVEEIGAGRQIYLSPEIPYGIERWHFYLIKDHRDDVFARSRVLAKDAPLDAMPSGSLFVVQVEDRQLKDPRAKMPGLKKVAEIVEPFGQRPVVFAVFERL